MSFDISKLEHAVWNSGLLPESSEDKPAAVHDLVTLNLDKLSDWERHWLTCTFAAQQEVEALSDAQFFRWLRDQSHSLHRWLAVPAVQDRIAQLRNSGSQRDRKRLGDIIARREDGRPKRLPADWVVGAWVRNAEEYTELLSVFIAAHRNPGAAWRAYRQAQPEAASCLERLGLDKRWFLSRNRPAEQRRTPHLMACEFVAAREGFRADTIRKAAGREKARRDRQARHRQKPS